MEIRIPVKKEPVSSTPLPERVGTIIVDEDTGQAYLLAVNPADQNTPYLASLYGDKYWTIQRTHSEPCEQLCYGDIENTLGTPEITLYTTEEYVLDLVAKKRQKRS
jgi:hypothetical protein